MRSYFDNVRPEDGSYLEEHGSPSAEPELFKGLTGTHELAFNLMEDLREQKDFVENMARNLMGMARDLKASVEPVVVGQEEDPMLEEEDQCSVGEYVQATFSMLCGPKNRAIDCIVQAVNLGLAVGLDEIEMTAAFRFPYVMRARQALPGKTPPRETRRTGAGTSSATAACAICSPT